MISRALEIAFFAVWTAITVLLSYWLGQQAYGWMPPQATQEAEAVDHLFSFLVTLGSVVFLGVFGMIAHSIAVCRAKPGDFSEGHPSRGSGKLELLWTAIPTVLVIWIGIQGLHIYNLLDINGLALAHSLELPAQPIALLGSQLASQPAYAQDLGQDIAQTPSPPVNPLTNPTPVIEVTAKQWAWSFRYPDQNITTSELHLQVNQPVRLALNSKDVLHGFYVPAFRIKQDIIPNDNIELVVTPRLAGKYRLHDSQFSGTYFSLMESDVFVDTPEAYQQWLATAALHPTQRFSKDDLAIAEQADPPNLWGQHWAVNAPDAFFKSALKANAPSSMPNS